MIKSSAECGNSNCRFTNPHDSALCYLLSCLNFGKPMNTITAYLTFNGNCREAMQYYQKCLGGDLVFQTVGESPFSEKMPAKMKKYIVHSELKNPKVLLFASDMVGQKMLLKGNSVSLALNCSSEKELKKYYKSLSSDGEQTHPPEETYWGAIFGGLTDKFGTNWLLNYQRKNKRY